jgi:hypothetical protein
MLFLRLHGVLGRLADVVTKHVHLYSQERRRQTLQESRADRNIAEFHKLLFYQYLFLFLSVDVGRTFPHKAANDQLKHTRLPRRNVGDYPA